MPSLIDYKGLSVLDSASGAGGAAINDDLMGLADRIGPCNYGASTNPTVDNDSADTAGLGIKFYVGSRWFHGTVIFDCVDATPGAAVWVGAASGGPFLPLSGGNMTGTLSLDGNTLNANNGSGTGGGTWDLDGGTINMAGASMQITSASDGTQLQLGDVGDYSSGTQLTIDSSANTVSANSPLLVNGATDVVFSSGDAAAFAVGSSGVFIVENPEPWFFYPGQGVALSSVSPDDSTNLPLEFRASTMAFSMFGGDGGVFFNSVSILNFGGPALNANDGSGSGGGTLSMDNGVITNAKLAQLKPQGSAPAAVAGGIYFNGSHFYGCLDGSTWTEII
jgi:hypothetical protein